MGTFAVLVLAVVKRDLNFKKYFTSVIESLRTAGMLLMLIAGSTILGHFIAVTNIPQKAADWIVTLPLNKYLIMIIICLIYEFGGSFIDDLAFMILATPIFYPIVVKLGYDLIWFGMFLHLTVMIGVIIPPVAVNVFVVRNITKESFGVIYKGVAPFLLSLAFVVFLLFFEHNLLHHEPLYSLILDSYQE
jgi:TRAP-type C4-dicarboxylate transport system permease large subunit